MVSGIILAGGSSTRYGTGENKTLVELLGRTACGTQAAGPRQSGGRPPQEGREKRW